MTDLHFAEPQWVHLLWVVLCFIAYLVWLERREMDALDQLVGTPLRKHLLVETSRGQRAARLLFLSAVCQLVMLR